MAGPPDLAPESDQRVTFRAGDPELAALQSTAFSRYPDREWATFFRCGWREIPTGLLLTLATIDPPADGDLDRAAGHVVIQEPYSLRTALAAGQHPLGIGLLHSHPEGARPIASTLDDDMDAYYAGFLGDFAPGRPYASLILSRIAGELHLSGRVFWRGRWLAVSKVAFERIPVRTWVGGRRPAPDPSPRDRTARLSSAFGAQADARLARSTVGVVGAGGTGSAAIEVLARAGVGRLIIVDSDTLEESNRERVHGSLPVHAVQATPKARVALHHVRTIAPDCEVIAIQGYLPQMVVLDALAEADVVLGCTDKQFSRLALSDLAIRYRVPAIDCAVILEGKDGRVTGQVAQITRMLSADPCPLCRGMIQQRLLDQELMSREERARRKREARAAAERGESPDPYWFDEAQINTVGYHTTAIGSMVAGYAIGWITGRFDIPFGRLQMNFVAPSLEPMDLTTDDRARDSCNCVKARGWGDQGQRYALVTPPYHWPDPVVTTAKGRRVRRRTPS